MTKTKQTPILGWIICSLAAFFYCYEYLLRIEPTVMVKELMQTFQANATEFGLLSAFYYFIYTPMQIVVGLLSDLYGPRRILTVAVITCTLGSYIFGIAPNIFIASIGRLLIGFGSAFAFVCVLKLTASWLPQKFFALFVGIATALGMAGGMFGIILLNSSVKSVGWKQTIDIGTIIGLILVPMIWFIIKDKPGEKPKRNTPKPKIEYYETFVGLFNILKNPQMWLNGFIACTLYLSLSLFAELWGTPFLGIAYPSANAANACSMVFLGWLVGGPFIGYISDITRSRKKPLIIGCLFAIASICPVIYFTQMNTYLLYTLLFTFGFFSSFEIICFAISGESNDDNLIATASAFTNCLTMVGGVAAQPLIGKLLDILWSGEIINTVRIYSTANYQIALTTLPLALFLGLILTFQLNETATKK